MSRPIGLMSNEIRQIFARIGLTDTFWDPRADRF